MAHGRWYPTLDRLAERRSAHHGRADECGAVSQNTGDLGTAITGHELPGARHAGDPVLSAELRRPQERRWSSTPASGSCRAGSMSTAPGRRRPGSWTDGPNHIWPFNRDYGTAVMYDAGQDPLRRRGRPHRLADAGPEVGHADGHRREIDLNAGMPAVADAGSDVGRPAAPQLHRSCRMVRCWSPAAPGAGASSISTRDWRLKDGGGLEPGDRRVDHPGGNSVMRVYHSVSLLLPDGNGAARRERRRHGDPAGRRRRPGSDRAESRDLLAAVPVQGRAADHLLGARERVATARVSRSPRRTRPGHRSPLDPAGLGDPCVRHGAAGEYAELHGRRRGAWR